MTDESPLDRKTTQQRTDLPTRKQGGLAVGERLAVDRPDARSVKVARNEQRSGATRLFRLTRSHDAQRSRAVLQAAGTTRRAFARRADGQRAGNVASNTKRLLRVTVFSAWMLPVMAVVVASVCLIVSTSLRAILRHHRLATAMPRRLGLDQQQQRCCPNQSNGKELFARAHDYSLDLKSHLSTYNRNDRHIRTGNFSQMGRGPMPKTLASTTTP